MFLYLSMISTVSGFLSASSMTSGLTLASTRASSNSGNVMMMATKVDNPKKCLIIGGTRFSGLYLYKELYDRGHEITVFNRGKTGNRKLPGESDDDFSARDGDTKFVTGDRTNADDLAKLGEMDFDIIFDMNGRERSDTQPLVEVFEKKGTLKDMQYVYMSSAGVYLKTDCMPHREEDAVDPTCRHKGKLDTENYLREAGVRFTSIRPTYIYGAQNYNPIEEYFFDRIMNDRPVCVPGHGQHLTGLGHVQDLAVAFANVIDNEKAIGEIYNVQNQQAMTFDGVAKLCAVAAGKDPKKLEIVHYNPKDYDFGKLKAFPFRPQHFFTSVEKAMTDLNWAPTYSNMNGLKDFLENDWKLQKEAGTLKPNYTTDDMILEKEGASDKAPVSA